MAFTVVGLKEPHAVEFSNLTPFVSQEYLPHKERDELGTWTAEPAAEPAAEPIAEAVKADDRAMPLVDVEA